MKLDENSLYNPTNKHQENNPYYHQDYLAVQSAKYKKSIINTNYSQRDPYALTNEDISKQFGQNNYEKGLTVISSILLMNFCWFYCFINELSYLFRIFNYINLTIEAVITISMTYIFIKIRQSKVVNEVPMTLLRIIELICFIYLLGILLTFFMVHFQKITIISFGYLIFAIQFSLELYFIVIILRLFSFSSCSYKIQESLSFVFGNIIVYLFCIDEDIQQGNDYQEYEELDSEY